MAPSRRTLLGAGLSVGLSAGLSAGLLALPARPWWRRGAARPVQAVVPYTPARDGAGVSLHRVIGSRRLPMLDPFLLLDEFASDDPNDYIAGFPDHPHRGFETVTIMLEGEMEHRDSVGNRGRLGPGSIQWMTAGRGIVHSEMPKQIQGRMWGFQLWVNLPARLKMRPPRYQDLAPASVPELDLADARVRLLAGRIGRTVGPVDGVAVAPTVLDAALPEGGRLVHPIEPDHNVFAYVTEGSVRFGDAGTEVPAGHIAVFGPGEGVTASGRGRLLLAAGAPIGEPVARQGPFVMNTEAEIRAAWEDYRSGRLVGG